MPLADDGRGVTLRLEQLRQRLFIGIQAVVVSRKQHAANSHALGDAAGHERGARRRTHRGDVARGELCAFASHLVDVRSGDVFRAEAAEVAVAEVIREDDDDVGFLRGAYDARPGSQHQGHGERQEPVWMSGGIIPFLVQHRAF